MIPAYRSRWPLGARSLRAAPALPRRRKNRLRHARHAADLSQRSSPMSPTRKGFFKKYGVDVELRQFDTGAAGARAVVAGDIDFALSPTRARRQPDLQCRCRSRRHLGHAQSRLGDRLDRRGEGDVQGHDGPAGRRRYVGRRALDHRLEGHADRGCGMKIEDVQQSRARLATPAPAMVGGPAHLRRAPHRRRAGDREPGQEGHDRHDAPEGRAR